MNERNCFIVLGISYLEIDSHFFCVGIIPFGCILNPSHMRSGFANLHFCNFFARFSLSSRSKTLSISF